jgi:Ca2+-transporting ATPase
MSAATIHQDQLAPYQQPIDDVLTALSTEARRGLTEGEARERLESHGKNELTAEKPVPLWRKFHAQFQDVLVILLLIATGISAGLWLYERESALPYEAMAIFAVVLLNAIMGYIQQSRAEAAVAALTGESLPVSKDTLPITEEVGLGDRHNMIFSGTAATYRRGRTVVVATGCRPRWGASPGC